MTELVSALLVVSILINVLSIWYIIRLLRKYIPISEDLEDLFERLDGYHLHVKTVTLMESYYGDDILMNLLRHSRAIKDEVEEFKMAYSLLDEEIDLEDEEEDVDEQDEIEPREHATIGTVQIGG